VERGHTTVVMALGLRPVSTASPSVRAKAAALSDDHSVRPPAYQTLADDLRAQIVAGRLRPGERLPTEPQLCARFGLSRSTVREALRLLASQQLIITTRGVTGGSFVAQLSPERLGASLGTAMQVLRAGTTVTGAQFVEMREIVEVPGAALAAERRTEEDVAALHAVRLDPDEPSLESKICAYWGIHAAMAAAAHNPLYELLAGPLRRLANDRELAAMGPAEFWHESAAAWAEVVRCVEARDGVGASAALRAHLRFLCDIYEQDEVQLAAG
jgi:GntR family transcriptional regulator, transcriptional repressor for pyruvate dehydrogenase complex